MLQNSVLLNNFFHNPKLHTPVFIN